MISNLTANNSANLTNTSDFTLIESVNNSVDYYINLIGSTYLISITCVVGFILNTVCLIVLLHPELKGNMYKFLIAKTLMQMVVHLSFLSHLSNSCTFCLGYMSYFGMLMRIIFFHYFLNTAMFGQVLFEIVLSIDRLLIFKSKRKCMPNLNFTYTTIGILIFISLAIIPAPLAYHIDQLANGRFVLRMTKLAQSQIFSIYMYVLTVLMSIMPFVLLSALNVVVVLEYNKYRRKKAKLSSKSITIENKRVQTTALSTIAAPKTSVVSMNVMSQGSELGNHSQKKSNKVTSRTSQAERVRASTVSQINAGPKRQSNKSFTPMIVISSLIFDSGRIFEAVLLILRRVILVQSLQRTPAFRIVNLVYLEYSFIIFGIGIFIYYFTNKLFKECVLQMIRNLISFFRIKLI
jgi:hypothetical protein